MDLRNYKNEIERLCSEYNRIRVRHVYWIGAMLFIAIWFAGFIVFVIKKPDIVNNWLIFGFFIVSAIVMLAMFAPITIHFMRVQKNRRSLLNTNIVRLFGRIIATETPYVIEPVREKPVKIAKSTGFFGRFVIVQPNFAFHFHIGDVSGDYVSVGVGNNAGYYNMSSINGDLMVFYLTNYKKTPDYEPVRVYCSRLSVLSHSF
jgi:uncharacterized membrane protein YhaH (DUF805 family)